MAEAPQPQTLPNPETENPNDRPFGLAFHPDGRRLASAGADRTIRLWDHSSGLELLTIKDHSGWVRRVVFSPDGRFLASASDDGTFKLRESSPGGKGTVPSLE